MITKCPTCKATHLEMDGCVGESYWCPQCGTLTSWIKEAKTTRAWVSRDAAEKYPQTEAAKAESE